MNNCDKQFRSILVIDDNESIHEDFARIFAPTTSHIELDAIDKKLFGRTLRNPFQRSEFELHHALEGKAGLEKLQAATASGKIFGLAFVDMRMPPGWDGVETIEQLWKVDPDLQVVICTAYSDRSWDDTFERLGSTDNLLIIKKPFDEVEVVQLANSLSEKRRLHEQAKVREQDLSSSLTLQRTKLNDAHKDAETLIDSMMSVLISLDADGIVSRWNPVASSLFGIPASQAVGAEFSRLPIAWDDWSLLEDAFDGCRIVKRNQVELKFVDGEGVSRTLDAIVSPILRDSTSDARLIIASDVTSQKTMQNHLDQSLRLESVGQLAAGVAHEINTPMQYIGDNVRFVSKSLKKLDPLLDCLHKLADPDVSDAQISEMRKALLEVAKPKKIKSSLKQIPEALDDAIQGVLSVSKIVSAMKEFSHPGNEQKSKVCINHVLDATITVARNEWKYVANVETDFEEDIVKIDGLPSELNQAFLNIVVNAAHAIGDRVEAKEMAKGLIRITTRSEKDCVRISITDNGGGILACAREKLFEPFFTTKEVGKGTGQGLSIAYGVIVQKHSGSLTFTVEEGVGTTFHVELPRVEAAPSVDVEFQPSIQTQASIESQAIGAVR